MKTILIFLFPFLLHAQGFSTLGILMGDKSPDTLGVELATNGDMELNSDWTAFQTEAGDSVNQSTTYYHSPTHSWRIQTDGAEGIVSTDFSVTSGETYYYMFWMKCEPIDFVIVQLRAYYGGEGGTVTAPQINDSDWHYIILKKVATATGNAKVWITQANGVKTNVYIDDISIKQKIN